MSARAENLARFLAALAPTALGVIGVLLLALPVRLAEGAVPTPILPLIVVYFWSIYGSAYLPPSSVFAIGLTQDLLNGGPLGLWPAIYLVVQYLAASQRPYFKGREQRVVWMGFALSAVIGGLILWLVTSLLEGKLLAIGGLAAQLAVTIAAYPLVAVAFRRLHRRVIVEA